MSEVANEFEKQNYKKYKGKVNHTLKYSQTDLTFGVTCNKQIKILDPKMGVVDVW